MILRRSQFVHIIPLANERVLVAHALTQLRLGVDREVERLIGWFDQPRDLAEALPELMRQSGYDKEILAGCIGSLLERGVLTQLTMEAELEEAVSQLSETNGRDPGEMLERFRRRRTEGVTPYWAVTATRKIASFGERRRRLDIVLLGDCDVQMEADFLVREGEKWGLDLRIATTFPDDVRLVEERPHDLILIGALRSRRIVAFWRPDEGGSEPFDAYIAEARRLMTNLRQASVAPILLDNLPEPTVQPLGLADRGPHSHRNRFRAANLALAALTEKLPDVHLVDVAAALSAAGAQALLDDGLTSFVHFGSPGWMLQRPESEKAAVHNIFPDQASLAGAVGDDPYRRERIMAGVHAELIVAVTGAGRKKCVIVDLDGVLWPGVLAETGSPFAWSPETSGQDSYVGLYFGIHEALKALKRRGVLLSAVSKNDEAVVREFWRYAAHYPCERLLTPDDFVTWRVNWLDKPQNIMSIAQELGFALDSFLFIDDHPVERERVSSALPEIEVWGEDLFSLRRRLLTDPRLQSPRVTGEAETRTALVKAQLERARLRTEAQDEDAFLASLDIQYVVERLRTGASLERVQEIFDRTTQFNTTGRKFTSPELSCMLAQETGTVFSMTARDRLGEYGVVAAAVVAAGEILAFAVSCRVIGLRLEQRFLEEIISHLAEAHGEIVAKIIETPRNLPARNLYRDGGFSKREDGSWLRFLKTTACCDST